MGNEMLNEYQAHISRLEHYDVMFYLWGKYFSGLVMIPQYCCGLQIDRKLNLEVKKMHSTEKIEMNLFRWETIIIQMDDIVPFILLNTV